MKKKIFITGISSLLMQKLSKKIDLSEYRVIGLVRNSGIIKLDNVEIIEGDICDSDSFAHHIQDCYMVIHAAAVTHSIKETQYFNVNLNATKNLVDISNLHQVKRFIFISSNTAGIKSGAYGLTKLLAEEYIQNNFDGWTILRPSEIYGYNSKEGLEKLINDVINKSIVFCPLNIPSKFFPIHIEDAVQMIFKNTFDTNCINKLTFVNGNKGFSFIEVIELVKSITNKKVHIVFIKKEMMFIIKKIASIIPINIGIIPDQIARLYSVKQNDKSALDLIKLETYIQKIVDNRKQTKIKNKTP